MVSYSTGKMNSLLEKLTKLKDQEFYRAVLSLKEDFFEKPAVPKVCVKQVSELVLEIEDCIDRKPPETNMLAQLDTEEIKYFKTKIKEAHDRFTWYYDLLKIVPTEPDVVLDHAPSKINTKRPQPVEEKPCHGLLAGPRDELLKHLTDDKDKMLKVVSVVGREGLGKTTLAKEIYSVLQVGRLFQCHAFVSVGRKPEMREILNDILRQVKPGSGTSFEVPGVITELREYLNTKRYFILVDGIWSTWAWKVITCALPNNPGSRVMTTTCFIDVANSCSSYPNDLVYQMEALGDKNSKILFRSRMTRQEERIADFEDVCGDMLLNMCGGIPLGIIIAADLLARKSDDPTERKMLGKFILSSLKQYSTSDGMTKILQMSYADLSLPLRSCFLYLSVFLGNYTIRKDHLIWLWGAEGFIPKTDEEYLWETGERYFNELVSRRLIQPVFTCDDDQAVGCTVHGVILDFIRYISREENFATRATELNSGPFPCYTIRRFSLDCSDEEEADTLSTSSVHLSSMRSLTVSGKLDPPVPAIEQRAPVKHWEEMHFGDVEGMLRRKKKGMLYRPDSPAVEESISDHLGMPSESPADDKEMHATKAPDVEGKRMPSDSPADDKEMHATKAPDVEGKRMPSDSPADDKEMRATEEAPGVSMFNLSAFKLLRVLHLEDTKNLKKHHLEGIGGLVLLRYLGLAETGITELPEEIGGLEQLETLDLSRNSSLHTFPASIVRLQKLRHLLLKEYAKEIWEMPELEVASGIRVKSSSSLGRVVELLKKSKQLRMLSLMLEVQPTKSDLVPFLDELVKSKLQSISIGFCSYSLYKVIPLLVDLLEMRVTAPLAKKFEPQRFELKIRGTRDGMLMRVPPNMVSLASLTHLHIILGTAKAEDFLVLGALTNLVLLRLVAEEFPEGGRFIIRGGIFPCLKVFSFRIRNSWMELEFEEEAMPQLQRLERGFRVSERRNQAYTNIGIEHLTRLTRVRATLNCQGVTVSQVEAAEAAIRGEISNIATKPILELSREYETGILLL